MPKKVIISLPHLNHGGSQRATTELVNYFVKRGIEAVILLMYNRPLRYQLDERVKIIEPSKKWMNIPKWVYPLFLIPYLRYHIKKENPYSVVAFGYKTYIFLACLNLKVLLIDSLRTNPNRIRFPDNKFLDLIYRLVRNLLNSRIDGIIAQTSRAKKVLEEEHKCEIKVIPNSLRKITTYNIQRKNLILSVGRLSEEKGHKYLLQAYSIANLRGWRLQIIGNGPQRSNLEQLSIKLNVGDSVSFEGFRDDVDFYMQQAKIFVLPSLIEGFPNALVEAMANGMACISFNCEMGPSEIIDHGKNGFLVEPGNVESLASYLTILTQDESLRRKIGNEAKKVKEKYNIEKIGEQYLDFLIRD